MSGLCYDRYRGVLEGRTASPSLTDASSVSNTDASSWRMSTDSSCTEFDDTCSISDTCSEIVPLKVSDSVRRMLGRPSHNSSKTPSLIIPLTPVWPSSALSNGFSVCVNLPSANDTPLSPPALALLPCNTPQFVPVHDTPLLDDSCGSLMSASVDSPSTPNTFSVNQGLWDSNLQLQTKAMDVLLQLSPDFQRTTFDQAIVSDSIPVLEMEQRPCAVMPARPAKIVMTDLENETELLSAISVPSPGGFFASLGTPSQQLWNFPSRPMNASPAFAEAVPLDSVKSPPVLLPAFEATPKLETQHKGEKFDQAVKEPVSVCVDRTKQWLSNQEIYLTSLLSPYPVPDRQILPPTPAPSQTLPATPIPIQDMPRLLGEPSSESVAFTSRKCVRFAEELVEFPPASPKASDPLLLRTFQHFIEQINLKDAFVQATSRFEALQMQRRYLPDAHRSFLQGNFTLKLGTKPKCHLFEVPTGDEEAAAIRRDLIAKAGKEQQMLQQVAPAMWSIAARKYLSGGSLLARPALDSICTRASRRSQTRILDIEGQPTASWGWAVALEYKNTEVCTAVPASDTPWPGADWSMYSEPSNHRTVQMQTKTKLPFPSNTFHIVSARTLHTLLKRTSTTDDAVIDEWSAMLAEIYRVLVPGGVLQFSLLDAEAIAPEGSKLKSLSKSFTEELHSQGYDPLASQSFLERLSCAGFEEFKRTWMSLPLGHGVGIEAVTAVVGSLAWEDWLLKVQHESEDECHGAQTLLGRVGDALAELMVKSDGETGGLAVGKRQWAGWKMLVGCAIKPESLYDEPEE